MKAISTIRQAAQRWIFKGDMPLHLRDRAVRVDFGLGGIRFVARDHTDAVLMINGTYCPTHTAHLKTGGHVIGPRDLTAASIYPWSEEWRQSLHAKICERVGMVNHNEQESRT